MWGVLNWVPHPVNVDFLKFGVLYTPNSNIIYEIFEESVSQKDRKKEARNIENKILETRTRVWVPHPVNVGCIKLGTTPSKCGFSTIWVLHHKQ